MWNDEPAFRETRMEMHSTRFTAPWGKSLKVTTWLSAIFIMGIPVLDRLTPFPNTLFYNIVLIVLPLMGLLFASLFTIRGYVLTPHALLVQRLGWNSTIPLSGLKAVEIDPTAMSNSIRTLGNGGLFCFAGSFYNGKIGDYRPFATDPDRSVVLKFSDRTVVVTPGDPQTFVAKIRQNIRG